MKKLIFFLLFLSSSLVVRSQTLDSVIRDIIKFKSATSFHDTRFEFDSIRDFHQKFFKNKLSQEQLEAIVDTTHSIDLKYYVAKNLLHYPSKKISDVFIEILYDSNNIHCTKINCHYLECCTDIKWVPYYSAFRLYKDTMVSEEIKENLKSELAVMDSVMITYFSNKVSVEEMDRHALELFREILAIGEDDNLKHEFSRIYFQHRILSVYDKGYSITCGCLGQAPELREELDYTFSIIDSNNLKMNYKNELFYFNLWLNSEDTEIQVYGAEALIRLQNMGAVLPKKQIKQIKRLKRSFKKVETCLGLVEGDGTDRIRNVLSSFVLI